MKNTRPGVGNYFDLEYLKYYSESVPRGPGFHCWHRKVLFQFSWNNLFFPGYSIAGLKFTHSGVLVKFVPCSLKVTFRRFGENCESVEVTSGPGHSYSHSYRSQVNNLLSPLRFIDATFVYLGQVQVNHCKQPQTGPAMPQT